MTPPDPVPFPIDHPTSRGAPDDIALIDRAGTMTFRDLETAVAALAGWLAGQGLAKGARVATWLPKMRVACVMPLAAARAELDAVVGSARMPCFEDAPRLPYLAACVRESLRRRPMAVMGACPPRPSVPVRAG